MHNTNLRIKRLVISIWLFEIVAFCLTIISIIMKESVAIKFGCISTLGLLMIAILTTYVSKKLEKENESN